MLGDTQQPVMVTCKERHRFLPVYTAWSMFVTSINQILSLDRVILKEMPAFKGTCIQLYMYLLLHYIIISKTTWYENIMIVYYYSYKYIDQIWIARYLSAFLCPIFFPYSLPSAPRYRCTPIDSDLVSQHG